MDGIRTRYLPTTALEYYNYTKQISDNPDVSFVALTEMIIEVEVFWAVMPCTFMLGYPMEVAWTSE
jgi:hypothetical protein